MQIKVKAKNGCICPIIGENKIATDKEYLEVKDSIDMRRLIRDGSLIIEKQTQKNKGVK